LSLKLIGDFKKAENKCSECKTFEKVLHSEHLFSAFLILKKQKISALNVKLLKKSYSAFLLFIKIINPLACKRFGLSFT